MKAAGLLLLVFLSSFAPIPNKTVGSVDIKKFAGTWYSLYSIPTMFDKGSKETTTRYTLNEDGYYNVVTSCKEGDKSKIKTATSKIFPGEGADIAQMEAQFIWPFKVDYWLIELAPDYSYAVVGHPDHKFLFILSRKPSMDKALHDQIVARCKAMGYATEKLTSQQFPGEGK